METLQRKREKTRNLTALSTLARRQTLLYFALTIAQSFSMPILRGLNLYVD